MALVTDATKCSAARHGFTSAAVIVLFVSGGEEEGLELCKWTHSGKIGRKV